MTTVPTHPIKLGSSKQPSFRPVRIKPNHRRGVQGYILLTPTHSSVFPPKIEIAMKLLKTLLLVLSAIVVLPLLTVWAELDS